MSNKYPRDGDELLIHYHGMTLDGNVFDSSMNRRQPFKFQFGSKGVN
jgi:peptidylprolyl isomerase